MTALTLDSIALRGAGVVTIAQPAKGFRFTLDSLLLADFCRIKPGDRVLEPGAGTGIISLLLAKKFPKTRIVADEIEPVAYNLLVRNIELNELGRSVVPIDQDIACLDHAVTSARFDVIVANPPYIALGSGRTSPSLKRRTARQDQSSSLNTWLNLHSLLKNKGRYVLVFTAQRAAELISLLRERNIEPKRMRFVHPYAHRQATLVLIEAVKAAGTGTEILSPLIVHECGGGYTAEMKEIYGIT